MNSDTTSFKKKVADFKERDLARRIMANSMFVFAIAIIICMQIRAQLIGNVIGVVAAIVVIITILIKPKTPRCFNCHYETRASFFGKFCPVCGDTSLKRGAFFTKCTNCSKTLKERRSFRNFKIRYCTHCGIMLDKEGF
jgi:hypothetical protein